MISVINVLQMSFAPIVSFVWEGSFFCWETFLAFAFAFSLTHLQCCLT